MTTHIFSIRNSPPHMSEEGENTTSSSCVHVLSTTVVLQKLCSFLGGAASTRLALAHPAFHAAPSLVLSVHVVLSTSEFSHLRSQLPSSSSKAPACCENCEEDQSQLPHAAAGQHTSSSEQLAKLCSWANFPPALVPHVACIVGPDRSFLSLSLSLCLCCLFAIASCLTNAWLISARRRQDLDLSCIVDTLYCISELTFHLSCRFSYCVSPYTVYLSTRAH